MTNSKTTKKALLSSALALTMCVAMLIATTFAWFTDTASTSVNKIQAGKLDVELQMLTKDANETEETWKNAEGKTLEFKKAAGATSGEAVLWEPGCTYELPALRVVNKGDLKLKYRIAITGIQGNAKLNDAIVWTISDTNLGEDHILAAGATSENLNIKGHMDEKAGNEYQGLSIDGISITVYATQAEGEYDSEGSDYDKNAEYNYKSATIIGGGETITLENGKSYTVGKATVAVDVEGKITYKNEDETGQKVTITTGGQDLTIDADKDTVYHYGEAGQVYIKGVAEKSYHEFGKVDILTVEKGRVVVEEGDNIAVLQVKPNKDVPIVAVPQGEVLETRLQVETDKGVTLAVVDNKGDAIQEEKFENVNVGATVEKAIPAELEKVLNGADGKVAITELKDYKAMIGTTPYESFDSALTKAAAGTTVKLMTDGTASNLVIDKAVTIDLNGKTLTATKQPHVKGDGVLTIQDSGVNGQLTLGGGGAINLNEGKLILNSGKIYNNGDGCVFLVGKAEFEMNGGSLLCEKGACIDAGYKNPEGKAGSVTINGGTIESKATATCAVYISGRAIIGEENTSTAEATITGGTIKSAGSKAVEINGTNSKLTVSGGTFNGNIVNTKGTVTFVENSKYKLNGSYVNDTSK